MFFSPKVSYLPTLQPKHFAQHYVLKPPHLELSGIYFIHNFYKHKIQTVYAYIFFPFIIRYNNYLLKLFTSDRWNRTGRGLTLSNVCLV